MATETLTEMPVFVDSENGGTTYVEAKNLNNIVDHIKGVENLVASAGSLSVVHFTTPDGTGVIDEATAATAGTGMIQFKFTDFKNSVNGLNLAIAADGMSVTGLRAGRYRLSWSAGMSTSTTTAKTNSFISSHMYVSPTGNRDQASELQIDEGGNQIKGIGYYTFSGSGEYQTTTDCALIGVMWTTIISKFREPGVLLIERLA
jgi:hypothetical protein